jgi:hypothetical protein
MSSRKQKYTSANHLLQFRTYGDAFHEKQNKNHVWRRQRQFQKQVENAHVECQECHRRFAVIANTDLAIKVANKNRRTRGSGTWFLKREECPRCWLDVQMMASCGYDNLDDNLSDDEELGENPGIQLALDVTTDRIFSIFNTDNTTNKFRSIDKALNSLTKEVMKRDEEKLARGKEIREMIGKEVK